MGEGFPTIKLIANHKAFSYSGSRTTSAIEAWARGGYAAGLGSPLPSDRSWSDRTWRLAFYYLWKYGMPVGVIACVLLMGWMCWSAQPTEEERERRRLFEERFAALERKHAKKKVIASKEAEGTLDAGQDANNESTGNVDYTDADRGRHEHSGEEHPDKNSTQKK